MRRSEQSGWRNLFTPSVYSAQSTVLEQFLIKKSKKGRKWLSEG